MRQPRPLWTQAAEPALPVPGAAGAEPASSAVRRRRPVRSLFGPELLSAVYEYYEGVCIFLVLILLLSASSLGGAVAAASLIPMVALLVVEPARTFEVLHRLWPQLLIGLLAVGSVLWSQHPQQTVKYGVQALLILVVGLRLANVRHPKHVIVAIALTFGVYVLISLALGHSVRVGNSGDVAFSGLTGSKNFMADISALSLLGSVAAFLFTPTSSQRSTLLKGTALFGILLSFYALVKASSAGATVGATLAAMVLVGLAVVGRSTPPWRFMFVFCAVAVGIVAFVFRDPIQSLVTEFFFSSFHKDSTLTGRAYLWYRANAIISSHPILGTGFAAFWVEGDPEPTGLWRYTFVEYSYGHGNITFHNTYYDCLVDLGYVGLGVFLFGVITGLVGALKHFVITGSVASCFWLAILEYELVRSPIESVGLAPLSFTSLLLFAALGIGMRDRLLAFPRLQQGQRAVRTLGFARFASRARGRGLDASTR